MGLLGQELTFQRFIMKASELGVPGSHNVENVGGNHCGSQTARLTIKLKKLWLILVVQASSPVCGRNQSSQIYNDSKSTNILATQKALSGFEK